MSSDEKLSTEVDPLDYEKYKQMILAYLNLSNSTVPKTKLAKLLYLADFAWFYEKLESMSGMLYSKREYGPVPDSYFRALDELEEEGKIHIEHEKGVKLISLSEGTNRQKLNLLQESEITLIKKIFTKWKDRRTQEMTNFTHHQLPYCLCRIGETISYELITQEDPKEVY